MARHIAARSLDGLSRDIEALNRLRISVSMDRDIPQEVRIRLSKEIDVLMTSLLSLLSERRDKELSHKTG